jgi:hypothetical protein
MITETERAILHSLQELEAAIRSIPTAPSKPNLLPLFTRIDELAARLPADASPDLRHYLQKKSYEKARLWLEGRNAEISRGGCRRD